MTLTPTRHAEIGAINAMKLFTKSKRQQQHLLRKSILVVVRFIQLHPQELIKRINDNEYQPNQRQLVLSCARPCAECAAIIQSLQLKAVIFSDENGSLIRKQPRDLIGCVSSGGTHTVS